MDKAKTSRDEPAPMRKLPRLRTFVGVTVISMILLWVMAPSAYRRRILFAPTTRMVRQKRIKPVFERLTGWELPGKAEAMRAVFYDVRGEEMYVAIHTTPEGCAEILRAFDGPDVEQDVSLPGRRVPHSWHLTSFVKGWTYQADIGADLFDRSLLGPIFDFEIPPDAGTVHYRHYEKSPIYWTVLAFENAGVVYIAAARIPPNAPSRKTPASPPGPGFAVILNRVVGSIVLLMGVGSGVILCLRIVGAWCDREYCSWRRRGKREPSELRWWWQASSLSERRLPTCAVRHRPRFLSP